MFNEITTNAIQKAFEKPLAGERPPGRSAAGAPHPGPPGRLQDLSAVVGQGPPRPFRRPRPDRRSAPDCRARARDPRVRKTRVLDHRCQPEREEAARPRRAIHQENNESIEVANEAAAKRHRHRRSRTPTTSFSPSPPARRGGTRSRPSSRPRSSRRPRASCASASSGP